MEETKSLIVLVWRAFDVNAVSAGTAIDSSSAVSATATIISISVNPRSAVRRIGVQDRRFFM
jgi:hypothetical protein